MCVGKSARLTTRVVGEQLVVKLITGRGGGGGTGSEEASWGTSGPVCITGRELMSMATPRKVLSE